LLVVAHAHEALDSWFVTKYFWRGCILRTNTAPMQATCGRGLCAAGKRRIHEKRARARNFCIANGWIRLYPDSAFEIVGQLLTLIGMFRGFEGVSAAG
jgi:hypothetical protein